MKTLKELCAEVIIDNNIPFTDTTEVIRDCIEYLFLFKHKRDCVYIDGIPLCGDPFPLWWRLSDQVRPVERERVAKPRPSPKPRPKWQRKTAGYYNKNRK